LISATRWWLALQDPEALHKYNAIFEEIQGRDYVFRLAVK
jgi:hypothetical protein